LQVRGRKQTKSIIRFQLENRSVYGVTQTIVDEANAVNLTLVYTVRVSPAACEAAPTTIQIQNAGIALTGESSNLIIEKL
jgi:hypothetical protein